MTGLAVEGLRKIFDKTIIALDNVGFGVEHGEFFCVVGPTNAGKSTLLKTIAGLHSPDRGRIMIGGADVTAARPHRRNVSLLFQNNALFPTLTGFENIAFPLRTAGVAASEIERSVHRVAGLLGIEAILDRLPRTFSGGEQQRVAIGRAIIRPGDLLMLDEPLTNLDSRIRIAMRIEFKKLHKELGQTILYVTHDQVEAMSLSDRIAVLDKGRVQQIGTPDDIYERPINRFVAEFVGSPPMNILDAELSVVDTQPCLVGHGFTVPLPQEGDAPWLRRELPRALAFAVRPERVAVSAAPSPETPLGAEIMWIEHFGSKSVLALRLGDAELKALVRQDLRLDGAQHAWIGLRPEAHHLLDRATGVFFT